MDKFVGIWTDTDIHQFKMIIMNLNIQVLQVLKEVCITV